MFTYNLVFLEEYFDETAYTVSDVHGLTKDQARREIAYWLAESDDNAVEVHVVNESTGATRRVPSWVTSRTLGEDTNDDSNTR